MSTLALIIIDLSLVAVIGGLLVHMLVWEKKWNERQVKILTASYGHRKAKKINQFLELHQNEKWLRWCTAGASGCFCLGCIQNQRQKWYDFSGDKKSIETIEYIRWVQNKYTFLRNKENVK